MFFPAQNIRSTAGVRTEQLALKHSLARKRRTYRSRWAFKNPHALVSYHGVYGGHQSLLCLVGRVGERESAVWAGHGVSLLLIRSRLYPLGDRPMSFWPTSDELRAGVRWIKRHPYLSGGLAAVAVGSALWYWLSEEDEEQFPKLPRQADLQPATGPGSDAGIRTTNPAGSNRKNVSVTSTPSVPVKRSVGWVDANGGELETRLPVRVDRSDSTGSIGMTLDASVDTPCTVSAPLAAVSAADVEQCYAVNDQSSISTSSTHASSQDSIDSAVIKGSSAPSSPRVPVRYRP
jgi:hypothetical protein